MQELTSYYLDTILKSRILLDEDMELILNNCKLCCESDPKIVTRSSLKNACALCFCGALVYKFRLFGFVISAPLVLHSVVKLYKVYKFKCYKESIELLVRTLAMLHSVNHDVLTYLKARELFSSHQSAYSLQNIKAIFNKEIVFIDNLMANVTRLCDMDPVGVVQPEIWKIHDLHLDNFQNQEECLKNFTKLRDVTILIISKLLCCLAINIFANPTQILDEITPALNKTSKECLAFVKNSFNSARSLNATQEHFKTSMQRNKTLRHAAKLEQPLSKLLTHLQLTFEHAQHVHENLCGDAVELEDLSDQILAMQEGIAICEHSLDQFCAAYGVLIKKSVLARKPRANIEAAETANSEAQSSVGEQKKDEEVEVGDEEYELYVGESDEDDFEDKSGFGCDDESGDQSAALLLVLQELKDRLKERRILRAKKLGLPLPEDGELEKLAEKKSDNQNKTSPTSTQQQEEVVRFTEVPPLQPPSLLFSHDEADLKETGSRSFADAIKLMARQRQQLEDVFQDSDAEESNDSE